ncbi:MAG: hypothetical protein ACRDRL_23345 [Sciscionella sp.]
MNTDDHPTDSGRPWAAEMLSALRLGQRLVAEVPAARPGRRAFVDITPPTTPADRSAQLESWKQADQARSFRIEHREYEAERIAGFDYDTGAVLVRSATATGEPELITTLEAWHLKPDQFTYPWRTDDPK